MNKTQLVEAIAQKTGLKKKDAEAAVSALVDATVAALADGDKVQISGLGTLAVKEKAARTGRNPQTGKEIKIAAKTVPAFSAGKKFKELVK